MLIYSEDRYISTEVNMMIIRAKDNIGYYYIHRSLYDQAVILNDLFGEDPLSLCELITGERESRQDVEEFFNNLPKPINILGCFLLLVNEEVEDPQDRIGAIHVMSGPINFRKWITVPREARSEFGFSLSIREEYQLAWDRFFKEAIPFSADFYHAPTTQPLNGTATAIYNQDSGSYESPTDEEVEADPEQALYDALMNVEDDLWDFDESEEEEEEGEGEAKEESSEPEQKTSTVTTEPTPEPEPEPEPVSTKPKSGLDIIRGWK